MSEETSESVASIAARLLKLTVDDVHVVDKAESLNRITALLADIKSVAASALTQREKETEPGKRHTIVLNEAMFEKLARDGSFRIDVVPANDPWFQAEILLSSPGQIWKRHPELEADEDATTC